MDAIGIFDSGLGGLTVMRQVMKALPCENLIYFGDTARLPYGDKSRDTIVRYSIENTTFLTSLGIKALIIACSTASACAVDELRQRFDIPIVDAIEPTVEQAVALSRSGHIAVLGTKTTIRSGVYQRKITERLPSAKVIGIACPLFVPLVEENFQQHPATKMIIAEYLKSIKYSGVDTVVLGCTHYPLLFDLIQEELGDHITILDSATACARKVEEQLRLYQLQSTHCKQATRQFYVSDDPEKFRAFGENFLGTPINEVGINNILTLTN